MSDERGRTALPIDSLRPDFHRALEQGHCVVAAATGSGKSTRLPVWAADAGGPVLVVQPRRVAATSLAGFVAAQCGTAAGDEVGYAVRLERRYSERTRVLFVTPGVALRWRAEGRLAGFQTVILDEFHERRWDTDLLLALLRADGGQRLVITSATLEGERLAAALDGTYLESPGRGYPVDERHCGEQPRAMPQRKDLGKRLAAVVRRALAETAGDVLAFLPGQAEIEEARRSLSGVEAEVVRLHGGVRLSEQRRALEPGSARRVVLATNIAETSLTVPGVTAVVDSGLERRTLRRNGRTVLSLQPISRASAAQRAGRAGRLQPGTCYRLWGHAAPLPEHAPPEVLREDLTELVLAAAGAGYRVAELPFVDTPREESREQAEGLLRSLGALDASGRITTRGQRLFRMPVDPELAHLVLAMPDVETGGLMADWVAGLAAGDRWLQVRGDSDECEALAGLLGQRCDARLRVAALRCERLPGVRIDTRVREEGRRLAGQLRELLDLPAWPRPVSEPMNEGVPGLDSGRMERALTAAARAMPTWLYVRRGRRRQALGNGAGDEVVLGEHAWFPEEAEAALVLGTHSVPGKGTRQTISLATALAPMPLQWVVASGACSEGISEPAWTGERLTARREWLFAGRCIGSEEVEPEGAAAREAAAELILEDQLLAPAGSRLQDDLEAWSLYVALGYAEGAVPEARAWLLEQLERLGVERGEDLTLLEPEDLRFPGVPEWQRPDFDERYPRRVQLPDLDLRIHYHVRRREVVAEKVGGIRRTDPKRWELPAWPGWRVRFQRASRVVDIR
ncbi:helicase-related protein [Halorhodospira halophila]|uniref:Helicase domain protein n=1 Tax=Halorhodospira halophila (strain DSM 244 / SL1) TaxID=349124 RepID=A1WWP7_HALHL|nr:helicase-related protein [Halorhodospira halophila]ABM62109.1 helicase domain protein [Halorhodospira halophila SL1]MBK1729437.1 ATP-dependent RNA helicase [Halorhodospira halophila]